MVSVEHACTDVAGPGDRRDMRTSDATLELSTFVRLSSCPSGNSLRWKGLE